MTRVRKRHTQVGLEFRTWGGKRRGAGRPAKSGRAGEPHRKRCDFVGANAFHVTLRVVEAAAKLRRRDAYHAVRKAMLAMRERDEFRIVHISLEHGHIHLIVEAKSSVALSKGMQGFQISVARRLNATLIGRGCARRGRVFADRFHVVRIGSPTQARNAMNYLLNNWRRHGQDGGFETQFWDVDYYSSGPSFRGWKELEHSKAPFEIPHGYQPLPVAAACTWVLATGWRKAGSISQRSVPGPRREARPPRRPGS